MKNALVGLIVGYVVGNEAGDTLGLGVVGCCRTQAFQYLHLFSK